MEAKSPSYCTYKMIYEGELTNDCNIARGDVTFDFGADGIPSSKGPFVWQRPLIEIIRPAKNDELIITAEPKMPAFTAEVITKMPNLISYLSSINNMNVSAKSTTPTKLISLSA